MTRPLAVVPVPKEYAEELADFVKVEVDEDALYDAPEAALIIGVRGDRKSRQNHMYEIPSAVLPRHRTGPNGGRFRWLGRDLLRYRSERRDG